MRVDARRTGWGLLLAAYVAALFAVVLAPDTRAPDRVLAEVIDLARALGAPQHPTDHAAEMVLNAVLTTPLALLASLVWPRPSWRDWTAGAFLLFGAVELIQGLLLPSRTGSASDVVANTLGCCVGALLAAGAHRWGDRGSR